MAELALNVLHKAKSFPPDHRLRSQLAAQMNWLDAKLTPFWDWVHERWSTNCDPGCNAVMGDAEADFKAQLKRYLTERRQAAWEGGDSGKRLRAVKRSVRRWRHAGVGSRRVSRLITRLRLGWNSLEATRARQQQSDGQCEFCEGGTEDRAHYLLQCPKWKSQRKQLTQSLREWEIDLPRDPTDAVQLLLGGAKLRHGKQLAVQRALGEFVTDTGRFDGTNEHR